MNEESRRIMAKLSTLLLPTILVLGFGSGYGAWAQENGPAASPAGVSQESSPASAATPEGVAYGTVITAHGKIVKVNKARKQVTLALPEGQEVTVDVLNPYNLNAAKPGEPFVARYYEIVTIRKKRPGESIPSASLKGGIATARPGATPGAVAEMHARVLVTVDAIDEAKGTVTVKAADGTSETVKARNPENLKRIKVGDQLVVTVSRAVGVTLQKESASAPS
jgi:hypothetical protein